MGRFGVVQRKSWKIWVGAGKIAVSKRGGGQMISVKAKRVAGAQGWSVQPVLHREAGHRNT